MRANAADIASYAGLDFYHPTEYVRMRSLPTR